MGVGRRGWERGRQRAQSWEREDRQREGQRVVVGGSNLGGSEVCDIQSLTPEFIFLFCLLFGELECKFQLELLFIRVSGSGLLHVLFSPASLSF